MTTGHSYTVTELRILVEVYGEPYIYPHTDLYTRVPATHAAIDAAVDHLVANGDLWVDGDSLMLTTRRTRERGRRMDRRWARREHAAKQKARRAKAKATGT